MLLEGGCHCGKIRYSLVPQDPKVVECNCSLCTKKGALHLRAQEGSFQVTQGAGEARLYQAGTKIAKHFFCPHCGTQVYGNPRRAPSAFNVNARTLDRFWELLPQWEKTYFDGRSWGPEGPVPVPTSTPFFGSKH